MTLSWLLQSHKQDYPQKVADELSGFFWNGGLQDKRQPVIFFASGLLPGADIFCIIFSRFSEWKRCLYRSLLVIAG